MTEITIKNKYFLGHYDYITVWAADEEYHLKYNSEITFFTSEKEEKITISLFFFKKGKMIIECSEKSEIFIELKSDVKKTLILNLLNLFISVMAMLVIPSIYGINIQTILVIIISVFFIFFYNMIFAVETIKLIEK
ncbi:hypothetical protein EII29_11160 [Leptotrichia sp. OH3620_COT-345]|uniref:hypothetical protein n=1 Tax=Leptotrichia sp. OH3620_COT-345 TaxID=2491048 RepID=UPI000F646856|nr:hypothetical protein [Leptotrichia sp. OH3620_COT-345]RRD37495.1 hypothetical protein EII29_11160 [Leptotrichia sp. OH3620_COT-345]